MMNELTTSMDVGNQCPQPRKPLKYIAPEIRDDRVTGIDIKSFYGFTANAWFLTKVSARLEFQNACHLLTATQGGIDIVAVHP
jgi:hypothetical protein